MKKHILMKNLFVIATAFAFFAVIGCSDTTVSPNTSDPTTDQEALKTLVEQGYLRKEGNKIIILDYESFRSDFS